MNLLELFDEFFGARRRQMDFDIQMTEPMPEELAEPKVIVELEMHRMGYGNLINPP